MENTKEVKKQWGGLPTEEFIEQFRDRLTLAQIQTLRKMKAEGRMN